MTLANFTKMFPVTPSTFLILVFSLGTSQVIANPVENADLITQEDGNTTTCGGVLHFSSGYISYKRGESFDANERCVWIVRPPSDDLLCGIEVEVIEMRFPGPSEQHQIHMIAYGHHRGEVYSTPQGANETHTFSGRNVVTITFHSDGSSSEGKTGFLLRYVRVYNGAVFIPEAAGDMIVGSGRENDLVRYPERLGNKYHFRDQRTFLFMPDNRTGAELLIMVYDMEFQLNTFQCDDYLQIHTFIADKGWSLNQHKMCYNTVAVSREDLVLIYFESDGAGRGYGFQMATHVPDGDSSDLIIQS